VRLWKLLVVAGTISVSPLAVAQDVYPSKPIKLVVPWAAGNLTDTVARMLSERLGSALGQVVYVDNKGGASGIIGMEAIARSAPDGYTIGISAIGPLAMNPALYPSLPYNSVRDFTPISMVWSGPMVVLVDANSPIRSLRELVDKSKQTAAGIDYATPGKGTLQHITAELLTKESGARLNHIPYRGSSQAMAGMLGGQIPVIVETLSVAMPHIRAGKLRPIAVSTASRSKLLPEVATISESGYPKVVTDGWICLIAPAGVPPAIQARLNSEVRKILATSDAQAWAATQGGWLAYGSPAELANHVQTEVARLGEVIRTAGIKSE